jgi:hypothetical protein
MVTSHNEAASLLQHAGAPVWVPWPIDDVPAAQDRVQIHLGVEAEQQFKTCVLGVHIADDSEAA